MRFTSAELAALQAHARQRARRGYAEAAPLVRDALASLGLLELPREAVEEPRRRATGRRLFSRSEGAVLFSRAIAGHQAGAARRLHRDQATVSRWGSGKSCPSTHADRRLVAELFGVPVEAWDRPWTAAAASAAPDLADEGPAVALAS